MQVYCLIQYPECVIPYLYTYMDVVSKIQMGRGGGGGGHSSHTLAECLRIYFNNMMSYIKWQTVIVIRVSYLFNINVLGSLLPFEHNYFPFQDQIWKTNMTPPS